MENSKNQKTFWPYGIILSIFAIIGACIWTIIIALDNPVEMDTYYLKKYQHVDRNINEIQKMQKEFFAHYNVKYDFDTLKMDTPNRISFSVLDIKTNKPVEKADITLLITRPDTNKHNQELSASKAQNGRFIFENIIVKKPGRWQFKAMIKIGSLQGFDEYEAVAFK